MKIACLTAVVSTDGSVQKVALARANDPDWTSAAMEAVSKWKYRPATNDGVPIEFPITLVLTLRVGTTMPPVPGSSSGP